MMMKKRKRMKEVKRMKGRKRDKKGGGFQWMHVSLRIF